MTLVEPVPLVAPDELGALHVLAIGGAGMGPLAKFYRARGARVSGCDRADGPQVTALRELGITTQIGHDPSHLAGVDTLLTSSAIPPDNPELHAAYERGIRVWHRSAGLASLMLGHRAISVAGAHGKTTTSAMLASVLEAAGRNPSYVIGAPIASSGRNERLGSGPEFVVEADESDGSFLQYPTELAVVTNVEPDHLDNWGTPERYVDGFRRFLAAPTVKQIVICIDTATGRHLAEGAAGQVVTYGTSEDADARIADVEFTVKGAEATVSYGGATYQVALNVPGIHNVRNATAAFVAAMLCAADPAAIGEGLAGFTGAARRFQLVASVGGVRIVDDYAHHPTELAATLAAARHANATRLVACFQPHLYSRTRDFAEEFGQALALADRVIVTDVYPAREAPIPGVTGELVADAARRAGAEVSYVPDKTKVAEVLASTVQPGDLVCTLGAGDVTTVGPELAELLR